MRWNAAAFEMFSTVYNDHGRHSSVLCRLQTCLFATVMHTLFAPQVATYEKPNITQLATPLATNKNLQTANRVPNIHHHAFNALYTAFHNEPAPLSLRCHCRQWFATSCGSLLCSPINFIPCLSFSHHEQHVPPLSLPTPNTVRTLLQAASVNPSFTSLWPYYVCPSQLGRTLSTCPNHLGQPF